MPNPKRRLLILGGTSEAADIAKQSVERFGNRLDVVSSLAGRTAEPRTLAGDVRSGGFGGMEGLAAYINDTEIDFLIDATHPFAMQISDHARRATEKTGTPRLVFVRPSWWPGPGDHWAMVADMEAAAKAVSTLGRRVFLTVGERALAPFAALADVWFLIRMIDPPKAEIPLALHEMILSRGPFNIADEKRLLTEHEIDLLVTRASGGEAAGAKIAAARELRLPVIMVTRPPAPLGERAQTIDSVLVWLENVLREGARRGDERAHAPTD